MCCVARGVVKDQLIADYSEIIKALTDTASTDYESDTIREDCRVVTEMIQQCASENARVAQSQADCQKRYDTLYKLSILKRM